MRPFSCFILIAVVLLQACSGSEAVPADIIQPQQMQQVVWDVLQADELAIQNKVTDTSLVLKNESFRLYDQVFAIHHTNRAAFFKSYRFYQQHPALYKSLMEGVKKIGEKEKKATGPTLQ